MTQFHLTLAQALSKMPGPYGDHYVVMLEHGTLEAGSIRAEDNRPADATHQG